MVVTKDDVLDALANDVVLRKGRRDGRATAAAHWLLIVEFVGDWIEAQGWLGSDGDRDYLVERWSREMGGDGSEGKRG